IPTKTKTSLFFLSKDNFIFFLVSYNFLICGSTSTLK
ncbi:hypothetical protein NT04LS_3170a, partial [Listeria seeligeri FSL S4-171]